MSNKPVPETHWIVELEEDPETGDLVMQIPEEVIQAQGWNIGDTLTWDINKESGEISLSKTPISPDNVNPS